MSPTHLPHAAFAVWNPLPASRFNAQAAAHLFRRAGVAATPELIEAAVAAGPESTVEGLLRIPPKVEVDVLSDGIAKARKQFASVARSLSKDERAARRAEIRKLDEAYQDEVFRLWAAQILNPETTVAERLVIFLLNVFVVSVQTVRDSRQIFGHLEILREHLRSPYPELCKAVSRSPAMIRYLNLDRSTKGRPNENFARELMELFVLGEGNYTEADVKNAARAFTGYRIVRDGFRFSETLHDGGEKTLFGVRGDFDGDGVIDLLFKQPAARTFLPGEFLRTYLYEESVSPELVQALGEIWAQNDFRFDALCRTVFTSRLFYEPRYRGNMVKDPVQVLFGSLQDLNLGLNPTRRYLRNPLRSMGQDLLAPPNVRGWVGGRAWISGATLSARRETVGFWFEELNLPKMNADERELFEAEMANSQHPLRVDDETLERLAGIPGDTLAEGLIRRLIAPSVPRAYLDAVRDALAEGSADAVRDTVLTILETAEYQLC